MPTRSTRMNVFAGALATLVACPAFAQQGTATTQKAPKPEPAPKEPARTKPEPVKATKEIGASEFHYREISDFYNIREAYSNVERGEWEFETSLEWETKSGDGDDYGPAFSLKYGITDTFHVELEVLPLVLGKGGDEGNGDLALIVFKEWWKEAEVMPAFGTWIEGRFPTGDGSSGVDGELHFNLTKTLLPHFRGHLEGYIRTANGNRGANDEDRRDFQWGTGPGFDYSFSDDTIATINYRIQASDVYGNHDENVIELGMAQRLTHNQWLKFAVDVGVDGQESTPNFGAKLLWSYSW
jgi:hypothetical protein